ncbi:hypothetical protein GCM10010478_09720 [Streptomyces erythrogriseus]|uniref:Uncharacterized protein n=2 Tax=Streptomyces TaxID=1883 RepID=A0ABN3WGA5_9ACTN
MSSDGGFGAPVTVGVAAVRRKPRAACTAGISGALLPGTRPNAERTAVKGRFAHAGSPAIRELHGRAR